MDATRRSEVTRGVVLPLIVLVVILAAGVALGDHAVWIALMAAVPALAAISAPVGLTVVVSVITLLAAAVLAVLPGGGEIRDTAPPLGAVLVLSIVAILLGRLRPVTVVEVQATTERRRTAQVQLQTQADLDSMTGLLNRRGAIRALGPRNTGAERVIAFLDCDLFKSVNDQYGGEVGDEFLQAVAGRLRHRLPSHDTVARWDGDEFLLAIAADANSARPALERLISGINGTNVRTTAGPIPATVSVGAALWHPGQELEDVISRAGRALYAAKAGGRGRIVVDDASEQNRSEVPAREAGEARTAEYGEDASLG